MTHAPLRAAGVTVQHHEQVLLAEIVGRARLLRRQVCAPDAKQTLLRRRDDGGGRGGGGRGRPLAGRAAEVRRQRAGSVLCHHGGQLFRFGVERVSGQHLAQVGEARAAQHVFVQDRRVVTALAEEGVRTAGQAERQGRGGVRHEATQGFERVEQVVSPRKEVHEVVVGARVEAPSRAALQHGARVAPVFQHDGDAGQGHGHDGAEVKEQRFGRRG